VLRHEPLPAGAEIECGHAEDEERIVFVAGLPNNWRQKFTPFRHWFVTLRSHKMKMEDISMSRVRGTTFQKI